jgi:hypothetical protein
MNRTLSLSNLGRDAILIIACVVVILQTINIAVIRISDFTGVERSSSLYLQIFGFMLIIYSLVQYIILRFVKARIRTSESRSLISIHNFVCVIQYISIFFVAVSLFDMVTTSSYNANLVEIIIWINQLLAIFLMGILSYRLILWYRINRTKIVLAYAAATSIISLNAILALLYVMVELSDKPTYVTAFINSTNVFGTTDDIFSPAYILTSILSFVTTWIASVMLLYRYSKAIGRIQYWILVSLPLVYFLSQFQTFFLAIFSDLRASEPVPFGVTYMIIFIATEPAGGILFGLAFRSASGAIKKDSVKDYAIISSVGIILLFSSNQVTSLVSLPYPPAGLVSVSFLSLSCYLILVGIYSSALSIARDSALRQSIKKSVQKDFELFHTIGSSEMEQAIFRRTKKIIKETNVEQYLPTESFSVDEDIKSYVKEVIKEVKEKRE